MQEMASDGVRDAPVGKTGLPFSTTSRLSGFRGEGRAEGAEKFPSEPFDDHVEHLSELTCFSGIRTIIVCLLISTASPRLLHERKSFLQSVYPERKLPLASHPAPLAS